MGAEWSGGGGYIDDDDFGDDEDERPAHKFGELSNHLQGALNSSDE